MKLDQYEKNTLSSAFYDKIDSINKKIHETVIIYYETKFLDKDERPLSKDKMDMNFKDIMFPENSSIKDVSISVDVYKGGRVFFTFSPSVKFGFSFPDKRYNFLFKDETKPTLIMTPSEEGVGIKGYHSRSYEELLDMIELKEITQLDKAIDKIEEFVNEKLEKVKKIVEKQKTETVEYKISEMISELKF